MDHHGPLSWLENFPLPLGKFFAHNGTDPHAFSSYAHINGSLLAFLLISFFSILSYRKLKKNGEQSIIPAPKFTLTSTFDLLVEGLHDMICGVLGPQGKNYFSFIATIFIFVLINNLLGLLPLGSSPTSNISTTVGLGIAAFVYYNLMGVKEHGLGGYLKHFLMGMGPAGIVIALLEMISHAIRPFSLGIRLYVNMFVDHAVVSQFMDLFAWILPVPLLLFGIVVCTIQAFVFAVLTAVYVQMAVAHDH